MREDGLSFDETLAIAQEKGYAEADPTNDIEGFDAYYKALVLSQCCLWFDFLRKR